jgi:hypothetical protein
MKDRPKKRIATIHNNLDFSHLVRSDNIYLLSWENSRKDMPIYDLYNFFRNNTFDIDFDELLGIYENNYPLLEEEKKLLFILLNIPDKLSLGNIEFQNCKKITKMLEYIDKVDKLTPPNNTIDDTNETQ